MINTDGIISTVAGSGTSGFGGDGGSAKTAGMQPSDLTFDATGNLYIVDEGLRIRKIDANGIITSVAGNGEFSFSGDGGPAAIADISGPSGLTIDTAGNLYLADTNNGRIRKIDRSGIITTIAGSRPVDVDSNGDGGPATGATLRSPTDVAVDTNGNFYIADSGNYRIRKIDPSGVITTLAGNGFPTKPEALALGIESAPALQTSFTRIEDLDVDSLGNVYIAEGQDCVGFGATPYCGLPIRIRKIDLSGGITTVAAPYPGNPSISPYSYNIEDTSIVDLVADRLGSLYFAEGQLCTRNTLGPDSERCFVSNRVKRVESNGSIVAVAGNKTNDFTGDGGAAITASLNVPQAIAFDPTTNELYVAGGNRIRKVDASGIITTVVGNGTLGYSGDGGPAGAAAIGSIGGMVFDNKGNLYIADNANDRIRMVENSCVLPWGGTITSGQGVAAYKAEVDSNCSTIAETRNCSSGVLSGSYTVQNCHNSNNGLAVLSPNGGEVFTAKSRIPVTWSLKSFGPDSKINISISRQSGKRWATLKRGMKNTGQWTWLVRKKYVTDHARIRICLPATRGRAAICDTSDSDFQIQR